MAKKKTETTTEEAPKKEKGTAEEKPAVEGKPPAEEKPAKGKEKGGKKGKEQPQEDKKPKEDKEAKAPAVEAAPAEPTIKKKKRPGLAPKRGKKLLNHMKNQRQKISKEGAKPLTQAIETLKKLKRSKTDETVEIHMSLGVDVTQADQIVRGTVSLPHGIGKTVRVLVFCQGENLAKAEEAGADYAGGDEIIQKIQKEGWLEFDVALATQDMMGKVSRLGKVLGPRGLMPTPKAGTVITGDLGQAIKDFKAGKVEYRTDKTGNVHAGVGKMSFANDKLAENIQTFIDQIRAVKPTSSKGQ